MAYYESFSACAGLIHVQLISRFIGIVGVAATGFSTLFGDADSPVKIDEKSVIPIGLVCAGLISIAYFIWRVASEYHRVNEALRVVRREHRDQRVLIDLICDKLGINHIERRAALIDQDRRNDDEDNSDNEDADADHN